MLTAILLLPQLLLAASSLSDFDCRTASIQIKGDEKSHAHGICFSKDRSFFVSANCQKGCDAIKKMNTSNAKIRFSSVGTPSSNLCHEIGGLPYFMTIKIDGSPAFERKTCYFKSDKSFVDEQTLVLQMK